VNLLSSIQIVIILVLPVDFGSYSSWEISKANGNIELYYPNECLTISYEAYPYLCKYRPELLSKNKLVKEGDLCYIVQDFEKPLFIKSCKTHSIN
jgi:hypothetical protein